MKQKISININWKIKSLIHLLNNIFILPKHKTINKVSKSIELKVKVKVRPKTVPLKAKIKICHKLF